jgi:hypothetical protein
MEIEQTNLQKALRQQLYFMKDFILTCRERDRLIGLLRNPRDRWYLVQDPDLFSLADLVQVARGEILGYLQGVARDLVHHITKCEVMRLVLNFRPVINAM